MIQTNVFIVFSVFFYQKFEYFLYAVIFIKYMTYILSYPVYVIPSKIESKISPNLKSMNSAAAELAKSKNILFCFIFIVS